MTGQQQERLDEISMNVNSLAERLILNGNDLSNLTYFYSELVELSESFLNMNSLNDPETSKKLMQSLESEMIDLQNKRIQEAIAKLKPYIDKRDDENKEALTRIETSFDLLMANLMKGLLKKNKTKYLKL